MGYLKHNSNGKSRQPAKPKKAEAPAHSTVVLTGPETPYGTTRSMQHDINHVAGLADVEESLDWIARGISKLTSDEHNVHVSVSTGYDSDPVKITLVANDYEDTLDRLVTAMERIADSVARLAGLNRPRLESWHEQDEYTPRYKDTAVDGGAPGPKVEG